MSESITRFTLFRVAVFLLLSILLFFLRSVECLQLQFRECVNAAARVRQTDSVRVFFFARSSSLMCQCNVARICQFIHMHVRLRARFFFSPVFFFVHHSLVYCLIWAHESIVSFVICQHKLTGSLSLSAGCTQPISPACTLHTTNESKTIVSN